MDTTITTNDIVEIANQTLRELHAQRDIINGVIKKQSNIERIYQQCENILKSMNNSFYRLFLFKNKPLPLSETVNDEDKSLNVSPTNNELELLKQINIEIGKELDLHNFKLNEALRQKPMS